MSEQQKDIIYIDIEDEITSIIDKIKASDKKIIALVLPKRSTVLSSIVNMKLLKRRADDAGKRVVLITSEKGLLPIAGAVGVYTAKTLQSKPSVPPPPDVPEAPEDIEESLASEQELDNSKTVGELSVGKLEPEETIDIDNVQEGQDKTDQVGKESLKKEKKIKIPNFDSFRLRLFLIVTGMVALIVLWFVAAKVLPKAKILVKADTSTIDISSTFTVDVVTKETDVEAGVAPAELKEFKKSDSIEVATSGQKDIGTKASGTVSLKNCSSSTSQVSIPAGSAVSSGGLAFITQEAVMLPVSIFNAGGSCLTGTKDVNVVAQQNGDKYNLASGQTFSVAGFSGVSGTNAVAMSGGTSKLIKVVAQADLDDAKNKIIEKNKDETRKKMFDDFQTTGQQAIIETFSSGTPKITSSLPVGQEADKVAVTAEITFTMLGIKKDDLKKFIEADAKSKVDINKQPLTDYGLDQLSFQQLESKSFTQARVTLDTIAIAGVKLDTDALKKQIAGKKKGDVRDIISSQTGVREVEVHYSPFWVVRAPKDPSKITIVVEQLTNNE